MPCWYRVDELINVWFFKYVVRSEMQLKSTHSKMHRLLLALNVVHFTRLN
jgi:hypothetical protein